MSLIQTQPWEVRLLLAAEEAFNSQAHRHVIHADRTVLDAAYAYCEEVTRLHSRTFFVASGLLPRDKRRAVRALYAFCRITDDIVDEAGQPTSRRELLDDWRDRIQHHAPADDAPVCLAWADAQARFDIPRGYAEQLINGVARDLDQTRYETFADLAEYAYGVASTVGLMAMHIVGFEGEAALPYAIKLGVALQITNILRDVGDDWRNGRLYLPQDELHQFGLTEHDIARGKVDQRWRRFMAFQIERNRRLYEESIPGIGYLHANGRFAIGAAAFLYRAILEDIENHDYDVFHRRAHLSKLGKVSRLPGIWWYSRRAQAIRKQA